MAASELIEAIRNQRRQQGLTVVFRREDGRGWDEWGFATAEQRDVFLNKLGDREHHVPAWQ